MKPLKKAHQKNVNVDLEFYDYGGLRTLFLHYNCMACANSTTKNGRYERTKYVYDWTDYTEACYEMRLAGKLGYDAYLPVHLFIEDQIKELKVICEDGYYYHTVAVMNNGEIVYITL